MHILDYHQRSKHQPTAYARGPDSIDWDAQPDPFRHYLGAPVVPLPLGAALQSVRWAELFSPDPATPPYALHTLSSLGYLLELSLALSAWKQYGTSRWSLRVNPSSGNLHPTEAYLLVANIQGLENGLYHYCADDHALELRCRFSQPWPAPATQSAPAEPLVLMALTSVHWREAWKYGERAFRYCQHDTGHALAAISFAAAALNIPDQQVQTVAISDPQLTRLLGLDRAQDFTHPAAQQAEAEHADCLLSLTGQVDIAPFLQAAGQGEWLGKANILDPRHFYQWPLIDEAAAATLLPTGQAQQLADCGIALAPATGVLSHESAATLIRQRRSAQAFDPRGSMRAQDFFTLLNHCLPRNGFPWNALPSNTGIHLLLFVHQVEGITPGLYCLLRDDEALADMQALLREQFVWQRLPQAPQNLPLYCLLEAGTRRTAANLGCQQPIAGDSAFSLAMLADMRPLASEPWRYRHLFWLAGAIGQILYLEAESAGLRGTGIGCFYDDLVHELVGINHRDWQVLYHFTLGLPLADPRITSWSPYRDR